MLKNWLELNLIVGEFLNDKILVVDNKKYFLLQPKENPSYTNNSSDSQYIIFNTDFNFIFSNEDLDYMENNGIENVVFQFGGKFYWSEIDKPTLNPLKYIGSANIENKVDFPYLGVHGGYELCEGSRSYDDWCKKANFLGIKTLGICEKNTLAGTLSFQIACKDNEIKSIIGETLSVKNEDESVYDIKLYCKDSIGWKNLLNINSHINVFNDRFIYEKDLFRYCEGLICVLCDTVSFGLLNKYKIAFDDLYFQVDFVEWKSNDKDKKSLDSFQEYLKKMYSQIKPILICDSYYLDKQDFPIKRILNEAGKIGFRNQSEDQFFKDQDYLLSQAIDLFNIDNEEKENKVFDFINEIIDNTTEIGNKCDFKIETGKFKLPTYILSGDELKRGFVNSEDLFFNLIEEGLDRFVLGKVENEDIYLQRIEEEISVIKEGGFVDYFLIVRDMVNWANNNGILTGIGRGSAGGSLIAMLLGITGIDPIKYDLLFERFLNKGRIKVSLPDIDIDFTSDGRDKVKRYLEEKYGKNNVASIGTFTTLQIKAVIKELGRYFKVPPQDLNFYNAMIKTPTDRGLTISEFFSQASSNLKLKQFIQKYPDVFNLMELCYDQPKNMSIHTSGLIIAPKIDSEGNEITIYDQIPVKLVNDVLITEWEGEYTEKAGYLKADILGIGQLDKFSDIIKLVKNDLNIDISLSEVDLNDENVLELFQKGLNEDVFQFGADGLKNYCLELKPRHLNDLIATVALYRPGPMEIGSHNNYIRLINGEREPEYDYMCEEITKETEGLIIYQEQVMKICQVLGGFTLVEADDMRKALGKKLMSEMIKMKDKFIEGAVKNKCERLEAEYIWDKIERFAHYSFNKSHSAAYAIIAYQCQYLKVHYPLQFWTVSLNHSKLEDIPLRINEIKILGDIKLLPPDINKSKSTFTHDTKTNSIYWSIESIKHVGEVAVKSISDEKELNGKYYSFSDFLSRMNDKEGRTGVTKRVIVNLIIAGCFDEIENIKKPELRLGLLKKYCGDELPEEFDNTDDLWKEHFWILKQKNLCGYGFLDYEKLYKNNCINLNIDKFEFISMNEIYLSSSVGNDKCIGGIISNIEEKNSKNGKYGIVELNSNDVLIQCIFWNEQWEVFKHDLLTLDSISKINFISGEIKYDSFRKKNILQANNKTKIEAI